MKKKAPASRVIEPPMPSRPDYREWLVLVAILLLAAVLRLWGLDKNGFGNPYYASAVRSMFLNFHNFFFVSFDPTGWVTVDKPPLSLWIQTLFAKILGFSGFSLILPQVLEGLGSVALVYHLVRRRFDAGAALLAGLAMALSPVGVAVDRYNNTDACLVLVLLLAAWALDEAVLSASRGYLMLALALAGLAFNTKMMAAFVVLPVFYLFYWLGVRVPWGRRFADLMAASLVLVTVALSWPLAVDLTPPEQRPFVGSTQDNSMISLSLGWNGFQRLLRGRGRRPNGVRMNPGYATSPVPTPSNSTEEPRPRNHRVNRNDQTQMAQVTTVPIAPAFGGNRGRGRGGRGGMMGTGQPGPLRLADRNMAGQMAWFLPLALVGMLLRWRKTPTRIPLADEHLPLFFWAGWFLLYAVVFSFMKGAMHTYYLVLLTPPLAALTGIGFRVLWVEFKEGSRNLLPLTLLLTAVWQTFIVAQFPDWEGFLVPVVLAGVGLAAIGCLRSDNPGSPNNRTFAPVLGLVLLFLCPFIWALSPVVGSGNSVEANPDLLMGSTGGFGRGQDPRVNNDKLMAFLKANHQGEKYLLAAQNSQAVGNLIIKTGEPMIALGGFMGADPIVTVNEFAEMVKEGQVRYFLLQGMGGFNPYGEVMPANAVTSNPAMGGGFGLGTRTGLQADMAKWVRDHGEPVDFKLWGGPDPALAPPVTGGGGGFRRETPQLFDLKPGKQPQPKRAWRNSHEDP